MVLLEQNAVQQPTQWTHYQIPTIHQSQQPPPPQQQLPNMLPVFVTGQPLPVVPNPIMDTSYPETQVAMSPTMMATLSDTQAPGTKRTAPDTVVEKSAERRQKRMIKNRESAARSRARKQAYTHELENKVSRLEEENERLKKQKVCFCTATSAINAWYQDEGLDGVNSKEVEEIDEGGNEENNSGLGDLQRMFMGEYPDKEGTKDFDREREWKEWKEREGECTALRSTSRAQISAAQNKLGPFLTTGFVNDNSIDA
nr:ABSCISIC ACID-INSENSITIVE 5-like protein 2 [Ipomoea batatas]GMC81902.1 ABSCISIC ACID-INSENSITIVE 5-like protein 2 [Ipomoea batatas]